MADRLIVAAVLVAWFAFALAGSWVLFWLYDRIEHHWHTWKEGR